MKRFSEELIDQLPEGMSMPPMLVQAMDWLEEQGARRPDGEHDPRGFADNTLYLYPVEEAENTPGASYAAFGWDYLRSAPEEGEPQREFFFVSTGGDGSVAGFWLDDDGKQWIVHMGSGSGSDWWGILSDDPADLLRFLAIGYEEPAFYELHKTTPLEAVLNVAAEDYGLDRLDGLNGLARVIAEEQITSAHDMDDFTAKRDALAKELLPKLEAGENVSEDYPLPHPPRAFQAYIKEAFGIDTPARASDFMPYPARGSDEPVTDPYAIWLQEMQGEPSEEELAYIEELGKIAQDIGRKLDPDYKPTLWERFTDLFRR